MSSSDLPKLWTTSWNISKFVLSKSFLCVKNWSNISQKKSYEEYSTRRSTFIRKCFWNFWFLRFFFWNCAQFLSALFIILVGLPMTRFSEKVIISTRCIHGFMSNLIKKSWTDSIVHTFHYSNIIPTKN